jgi:hypothetical protein
MATKAPDTCRLTVVIRGVAYSARPIRADLPEIIKAWRIRKSGGETYDVADTTAGPSCTCADHEFRHQGNGTSCKHGRALRALGLLDPEGTDPSEWPAWTDHAAFTVAR